MTSPNYNKIYSILGVFQDDDWDTVRAAYKKQIRRWHPDRFQDTDQRKIAEDKSKDINLAYQTLDAYFREFGTLPSDEIAQRESPLNSGNPATSSNEPAIQPEQYEYSDSAYVRTASGNSDKPQRSRYTRIILAIVVLAIGYTMLEPVITGGLKVPVSGQPDYSESTMNAHNFDTEQAGTPDSGMANATAQSADIHPDWQVKEPGSARKTSPPYARPTFISRGSSKQEVLAIQGRPLRQTDTAWDYGLSRINFRDGKVESWYENPMNPLIVQR